jgi:phospholipid-binding lipoprotein MlaA
MLPAAIVIAGLALPEAPPQPRPAIEISTRWQLTAGVARGPLIGPALAEADAQPRRVGPGQVVPPPSIPPAEPEGQVEVVPSPDEAQAPPAEAAPQTPGEDFVEELKSADDPLEGFNRISFEISMALDKALIRPAAMAYKTVVPKPLRDGVRNGLSNLGEPMVFVNDLLQLKPKRAVRTLGRFLLNSILGLGGLFDVASDKKFNLPHHSNSFGNTLGFYGVKPGPYVYLPILGPTTLRDAVDNLEGQASGAVVNNPVFRDEQGIALTIAGGLDQRAENDRDLKALLEDAVDPYATFRETWLQDRQGEIDGLKAPDGQDPGSATADDPLADPLEDPAKAPRPAG